MKTFQRFVVLILLGVWTFPAVSQAKPGPAAGAETSAEPRAPRTQRPAPEASDEASDEASALATREQQSKNLQDFRGGEGVYVYVGSGAMLVVVLVLLILLL